MFCRAAPALSVPDHAFCLKHSPHRRPGLSCRLGKLFCGDAAVFLPEAAETSERGREDLIRRSSFSCEAATCQRKNAQTAPAARWPLMEIQEAAGSCIQLE